MTDVPTYPPREKHLSQGAWALPVFGVLLVLGTLTHQPDATTDVPAYARCLTTGTFPGQPPGGEHPRRRGGDRRHGVGRRPGRPAHAAPGRMLLGTALSVVGHVLNTALYGVAAFAQPAIGRAYQDGKDQAVSLNSDVYGPELGATAGVSLLFWTAGAVVVGTARAPRTPSPCPCSS